MSQGTERPLSRRRYLHLSTREVADAGSPTIILGLVPAAADTEVRSVDLKPEDWPALADQLDAAAAALRAHASSGGVV